MIGFDIYSLNISPRSQPHVARAGLLAAHPIPDHAHLYCVPPGGQPRPPALPRAPEATGSTGDISYSASQKVYNQGLWLLGDDLLRRPLPYHRLLAQPGQAGVHAGGLARSNVSYGEVRTRTYCQAQVKASKSRWEGSE